LFRRLAGLFERTVSVPFNQNF